MAEEELGNILYAEDFFRTVNPPLKVLYGEGAEICRKKRIKPKPPFSQNIRFSQQRFIWQN
ncbi:MAG: hypothetical protein NWR72_07210 [Bacteroidia bacterium]|nr:hypothetical protein [Bacteroidia bacterium]